MESKVMNYVKNERVVNLGIRHDRVGAIVFPRVLQVHEASLISQDSI